MDNAPFGDIMALDHWAPKPRFWTASVGDRRERKSGLRIVEERNGTFAVFMDFDKVARKTDAKRFIGIWSGASVGAHGGRGHVDCDPVRETMYYQPWVIDLKTGIPLERHPKGGDDVEYDKRGYMHVHFNPGFYLPGVARMSPDRKGKDRKGMTTYGEVPYDYGVAKTGKYRTRWMGVLPVRDQPGAKFFQDGMGVNMKGDIAVQTNVYYVPKMEDYGAQFAFSGTVSWYGQAVARGKGDLTPAKMLKRIKAKQRRGEVVYSIPRRPGVALAGSTVWIYGRSGELIEKSAVITHRGLNNVQIDEDRKLYFTISRDRSVNGKPFLSGRQGRYGRPGAKVRGLGLGTYMRTRSKDVRTLTKNAVIPLDPVPGRPQELVGAWVRGADWIYAGASPVVHGGCTCPSLRPHLDWYRRSYVPEAYRHSIGILDTNGNLIMHLGKYGNFDSPCDPDEEIGITLIRFLSSTDNFLVWEDWGERMVVMRLQYHAEETVPIGR
jgi:hypothetical protein